MENAIQVCKSCSGVADESDAFCKHCGKALTGETLPARIESRAVARRERASLPTPVKRAVTAVAIGTALQIGSRLAGRYVAKQAGKSAANALRPSAKKNDKGLQKAEETTPASPYEGAVAVSETLTVRRVWIRRE